MRRIVLILSSLLSLAPIMAQTAGDVTLTTTGIASSEEEATLLALRSAIEQVYGTFVSSDTRILDDELILDEIVSVSRGNVKQYDKVASLVMPNGQVSVTLRATISISQLTSYAESKGSSAEFAGQLFAMNIKLMDLKQRNINQVYKMMVNQISIMLKDAFDYRISISDPKMVRSWFGYEDDYYHHYNTDIFDYYKVDVGIDVVSNDVNYQIFELMYETLKSMSLNVSEISEYQKLDRERELTIFYYDGRVKPFVDNYDKQEEWLSVLPINYHNLLKYDYPVLDSIFYSYFNYSITCNGEPLTWTSHVQNNVLHSPGITTHFYGYNHEGKGDVKYLCKPIDFVQDAENESLPFLLMSYCCGGIYADWANDLTYHCSGGKRLWRVVSDWADIIKESQRCISIIALERQVMDTIQNKKRKLAAWQQIEAEIQRLTSGMCPFGKYYIGEKDFCDALMSLPVDMYNTFVSLVAPSNAKEYINRQRTYVIRSILNSSRYLTDRSFSRYSYKKCRTIVVIRDYQGSAYGSNTMSFSIPFYDLNSLASFSGIEIKHN